MNADAIIFDFNGTLLQDDQENHDAWGEMFLSRRGVPMSDADYLALNGKTDPECAACVDPTATPDEIRSIWVEKEGIYERMCKERKITLTPHAEEFLDTLTLPLAIATSAPLMNMQWYYPYFSLDRWFSWDRIVCGREDLRGKPEPDYYLEAARILGADITRCIIFEDSMHGLEAARRAGAARIISLRPSDIADKVIADFSEVKREDLIL